MTGAHQITKKESCNAVQRHAFQDDAILLVATSTFIIFQLCVEEELIVIVEIKLFRLNFFELSTSVELHR